MGPIPGTVNLCNHDVNLIFFTWICCTPRPSEPSSLPAAYLGTATGLPFPNIGLGNTGREWGRVREKLVPKAKGVRATANADVGLWASLFTAQCRHEVLFPACTEVVSHQSSSSSAVNPFPPPPPLSSERRRDDFHKAFSATARCVVVSCMIDWYGRIKK